MGLDFPLSRSFCPALQSSCGRVKGGRRVHGVSAVDVRSPGPAGPKKKRGINARHQKKKNECQIPKKRGITARFQRKEELLPEIPNPIKIN